MKRSGLRGVNFNRKRCCGSDKNSHVRRRSRIIMKEPLIRDEEPVEAEAAYDHARRVYDDIIRTSLEP